MRAEELVTLGEAGSGAGGIVYVVRHTQSGVIMARKVIARPALPRNGGPVRARSEECLSNHSLSLSPIRRCGSASILGNGIDPKDPLGHNASVNQPDCPLLSAQPTALSIAEHEASVMQSCSHGSILRCLGVLQSDCHNASLLLEYMDAGSLDAAIRDSGTIPLDCLAYIAAAIVSGLNYLANDRGMLHRDLKPSNVLLSTRGDVKLCDFGEAVSTSRGRTLSVVGTAAYMAPERLRNEPYGPPADVWSLGVIIAEAVAGANPFSLDRSNRVCISPDHQAQTDSPGDIALVELYEAVCSEDPPRLNTAAVGHPIADFVAQCLQHDPNARATAASLMRHPLVASAHLHRDRFCQWASSIVPRSFSNRL